MTDKNKRFIAAAASLLLGLGAAAALAGASQAGSDNGPVRCEIQTTASGGMLALESVIKSDIAANGSYRFTVRGSGTNISQGGEFSTMPGETVTLGKVMLGGNGVAYDANLEVTAYGKTVKCAERVGGLI